MATANDRYIECPSPFNIVVFDFFLFAARILCIHSKFGQIKTKPQPYAHDSHFGVNNIWLMLIEPMIFFGCCCHHMELSNF